MGVFSPPQRNLVVVSLELLLSQLFLSNCCHNFLSKKASPFCFSRLNQPFLSLSFSCLSLRIYKVRILQDVVWVRGSPRDGRRGWDEIKVWILEVAHIPTLRNGEFETKLEFGEGDLWFRVFRRPHLGFNSSRSQIRGPHLFPIFLNFWFFYYFLIFFFFFKICFRLRKSRFWAPSCTLVYYLMIAWSVHWGLCWLIGYKIQRCWRHNWWTSLITLWWTIEVFNAQFAWMFRWFCCHLSRHFGFTSVSLYFDAKNELLTSRISSFGIGVQG